MRLQKDGSNMSRPPDLSVLALLRGKRRSHPIEHGLLEVPRVRWKLALRGGIKSASALTR
jgi:hypothetical protein